MLARIEEAAESPGGGSQSALSNLVARATIAEVVTVEAASLHERGVGGLSQLDGLWL
jgi:hypothetical protein